MNRFGLEEKVLQQIQKKISEFPEISEGIIFGSRAMGNYKNVSDIDIAIDGKNISFNTVSHLHEELEEKISTPLFFDVVSLSSLENSNLRNHIQEFGVKI